MFLLKKPKNLVPPLSLYIHIPWCVRKCPYCDFNSHAMQKTLPEAAYVDRLLIDLQQEMPKVAGRSLLSIFIGGGTPSLFSPEAIERLLQGVKQYFPDFSGEVTLEANPGTVDHACFAGFHAAGVNRLSIGVQSFQTAKLAALGRIHSDTDAIKAVEAAKLAGFQRINIDLMYGLPGQTIEDAKYDLDTALALETTHLSWYQLTIEPNTLFHRQPPVLPQDDFIVDMQTAGQEKLASAGFQQYEVSAYSKQGHTCVHNINYWQFGDYLGIGAGAHGKITDIMQQTITRTMKLKNPKAYLQSTDLGTTTSVIATEDLPFEFMLNALRLQSPVSVELYEARTGLSLEHITPILQKAEQKGLLTWDALAIRLTTQGQRFLNDVIGMFLR